VKPGKNAEKKGRVARKPGTGRGWIWAALLVGVAVLGFAWYFREKILWDFRLGYCAAWLYRHGQNPFDNELFFRVSGEEMPFAYPLPTTLFYMPLTWLDWPIAARVWLVATVVLLGMLILFWWREFSGGREDTRFPLMALLSFNLAIPKTVLTGNTVTVESALLWGAFYLLARGRVRCFVALALSAASFKLSPLLFLALPLLHPQLRRWRLVLLSGAVFAAYLAAAYALAPGWFGQYLENVGFNAKQWAAVDVLAPSTYGLGRRLSLLFATSSANQSTLTAAWCLWGLMIAPVVWLSWKAFRVLALQSWDHAGRLAILYTTLLYALVSPRMSDYSYILVIPAAMYGATKLVTGARSWLLLGAFLVPLPFISFRDPASGTLLEGDFFFGMWSYWSLLMVFVCWCAFTRYIMGSMANAGRETENGSGERRVGRAAQR
jgi:hypothetical protein